MTSSLLEDERASRDLELSLVTSLELKPLDKLPLPHMLFELQPPLLAEYVEEREFPLLLLSDVVGVPMLVKDRDCNMLANGGWGLRVCLTVLAKAMLLLVPNVV
jgi:hypothetical protein